MMDAVKIRLWYLRETASAYLYSTLPPERHSNQLDELWVPKSIVEGRTKRGNEHVVNLPDWFVRKKGL